MDGRDEPEPQYEGEDTRPTSERELSGFYMYGWAAEVFVVCGIGSFIPVTLEQLARENGVLLEDRTTPCKPSLHDAMSIRPSAPNPEKAQCVVHILGVEINTASFAMYTFSISVLIQALLIISMSGAADHGRFRKTFLLCFAFVGSIATMLFLPVVPKLYILGAVLAIIANTCFGASFVLLNSFLPLLVRNHPAVKFGEDVGELSFADEDHQVSPYESQIAEAEPILDVAPAETTMLLPRPAPGFHDGATETPAYAPPSRELALSTQISSYGIAIGYLAALIVQTLSILVVSNIGSSNFGLRLVLFLIGLWWFIFSIPTAWWLRPRPGPPLSFHHTGNLRTVLAYFTYSWRSLLRTISHARLLKDVLLFLAAWFLLSDSIATVSGTAVLFAKTTLGMSYAMLALINVIATLSGVVGAFAWSRISVYMRLRPSQTILACILLFELIPLYGLLGYIPAIRRLGSLGLQQQWEMYPLGAVYGFVLGGLSSYCRSVFGELIPPGWEAAFFALYAITDKGSSVFGPAVVGAITDRYGEIRPAFWFLAVLIGLPFPIMLAVDVDRGRADGIALARELEEKNRGQEGREPVASADGLGIEHEERF
ncbi:UMF1 family MFS transporter [Sporormia fimetaria CBS 119925]|uniref:Autophagy-related protein n=1 Tax=Sporormia fimetaria CBS 119925 TaxID=1340428 RepID=A0A6A6VQU6_9PLEO|nr:UMF1 family MFS transporter [Sporormia fimetaria CBS 119925]